MTPTVCCCADSSRYYYFMLSAFLVIDLPTVPAQLHVFYIYTNAEEAHDPGMQALQQGKAFSISCIGIGVAKQSF